MNISSTNYGPYRVTRNRDDSVTVLHTVTGKARDLIATWTEWRGETAKLASGEIQAILAHTVGAA